MEKDEDIWEAFARITKDVPPEVWETLKKDTVPRAWWDELKARVAHHSYGSISAFAVLGAMKQIEEQKERSV